MDRPLNIVGVGMPAGSLEALGAFLGAVPPDSGLAYVIVPHPSPDQPPTLDQALARHTCLPVTRIVDGLAIERDRVHVAPAGASLALEGGTFRLAPHEAPTGPRDPIDRFFASLAEQFGRRACGVVLSGTGSDGLAGARAVKAAGGCAILQGGQNARFPGTPDSAAVPGFVDGALPPEEIPARIAEIMGRRDPSPGARVSTMAPHRSRDADGGDATRAPVETRRAGGPADRALPVAEDGPGAANATVSANDDPLAQANSDLKNLREATEIATLFLDREDRVRLFTPATTALFALEDGDIGRPIADVVTRLEYPELSEDARAVQRDGGAFTREVRLQTGDQVFEARIGPYRTVDDRLDGCVLSFVDITNRKADARRIKADAKTLARQYAELESLYDKTPVGLSLIDRDTRWLRINQTLAEINGLSAEEHVGRRAQDVLPDIVDAVKPVIDSVFETGNPRLGVVVSGETAAQPGVMREWLADYFPVRDETGIFAVGTVVREVTEQRALERRLIESEARLRRLFDQAPAMILITEGPEQRVIYANPPAEGAIGRGDVVGMTLDEAVPGLKASGMLALFERVFETGEPRFTQEIRAQLTPDDSGGRRQGYFRQIIQPWFREDGRIGGTMLFSYDISDAVRSRRAAHEARDRLQKVQDSIDAFVGLLDLDGTLIEANRTAIERAGLTREDVIGKKFWDCHWWSHDPEGQARLKDAVRRAAGGEAVRYDADIRLHGDDLARIAFQLVPRHDETGAVTELIPSGMDITERARAEERKTVLMAELQHRVKNVLATVQAIMRFTARKSATKDEMVQKLQQRLSAIARTHDALTRENWGGRLLRDLIEEEVRAFMGAGTERLRLTGPDIRLEPEAALSLGLAMHELTTNAAKYGALATDEGMITITLRAEGARLTELEWRETGGPPTQAPEREGFGTFLLTKVLGAELGASVDLWYPETGLVCRVKVDNDRSVGS